LLEQENSDGPFRVVSISARDAIKRVCDLMRPPAAGAQGSNGRNQ
jgi:hypothetical protein